jgi:hypothetical protein
MVAAKPLPGLPPFIGGTEPAGRSGVCFGKGNHRYISRNQTSKIWIGDTRVSSGPDNVQIDVASLGPGFVIRFRRLEVIRASVYET